MNVSTAAAPSVDHRARMSKLQAQLDSNGWTAALVLDAVDVRYLTGLTSSNAALLMTSDGAHIATDFRYVTAAQALRDRVPGGSFSVHQLDQGMWSALGRLLGDVVGSGAVAYSPGSLSHRAFLQLTESLPADLTLRAADGIVAKLRVVKDAHELDAIRRASALLDDAYAHVLEQGIVGRTEVEVAWMVERFLRDAGAEALSFPSIVAAGGNGASPHHAPTRDEIPLDTLVTIDIGCVVDGYCSDCTRTFATGNPSETLREIYDVTQRAQMAALDAVRTGASGSEVDAVARAVIDEAGYGERFGHGLGHGVGMEVHEAPRLARTSNDELAAGMVVTVEPGIYVPGEGGVRIEDLTVVGDGGPEILTGFGKDLTFAD